MISSKAEYACLALIDLARSGLGATPKRIREIADAQGIPRQYLTQILLRLKAAGLVQSARGSIGGYQLARSPEGITVAEVLVAIDGCEEAPTRRHSAAARSLAELLGKARSAEQTVLSSATIADLAGAVAGRDGAV
jgi:Rrf2 family protein